MAEMSEAESCRAAIDRFGRAQDVFSSLAWQEFTEYLDSEIEGITIQMTLSGPALSQEDIRDALGQLKALRAIKAYPERLAQKAAAATRDLAVIEQEDALESSAARR